LAIGLSGGEANYPSFARDYRHILGICRLFRGSFRKRMDLA
jgi:hypothetical protein